VRLCSQGSNLAHRGCRTYGQQLSQEFVFTQREPRKERAVAEHGRQQCACGVRRLEAGIAERDKRPFRTIAIIGTGRNVKRDGAIVHCQPS
jgi:hypothetical protein